MKNLTFKNRLQFAENQLSKSEKKIAEYVSAHIEEISRLSITELADKTNTSPSAITRFCQKLDYRRFIEFQTLLNSETHVDAEPADVVDRITRYYHQTLDASTEIVHEKHIYDFTDRIMKANKIIIIGIGSSGLTAIEFSVRLTRMGLNCASITDSYNMIAQASLLTEEDLLIAVSNSGETSEIIKSANIAKSNGASIIALTKANNTSLTALATTIFFTSRTESISDEKFFNDQLSLLFFIDIVSYILLGDEQLQEKHRKATMLTFEKDHI